MDRELPLDCSSIPVWGRSAFAGIQDSLAGRSARRRFSGRGNSRRSTASRVADLPFCPFSVRLLQEVHVSCTPIRVELAMESIRVVLVLVALAGLGFIIYFVSNVGERPPAPAAPNVAPATPAPAPAMEPPGPSEAPAITAPTIPPSPTPPPAAAPLTETRPPLETRLVLDAGTEAVVYKLAQDFVASFLPAGRARVTPQPHSAVYDVARQEYAASVDVTQNRSTQRWSVRMRWADPVWQLLVLDTEDKTRFSIADHQERILRRGPAPRLVKATRSATGEFVSDQPARVPEEPRKSAEPKQKQPVAERKPAVRTWTDDTGKYTIEAEFRGVVGGQVRLRKLDGSEISLPMEKLSLADRQWIRFPSKRKAAALVYASPATEPAAAGGSATEPGKSATDALDSSP